MSGNPGAKSRALPAMAHNAAFEHHRIAMKRLIAFCMALASASVWPQSAPQLDLPRETLKAGMHLIQAQVAATPQQRATGLMFRQDMPANEGMLFVFEQPAVQCFWMKNTLLPLTAAFVEDDGTVVNLADMQPQTEASHCSSKPVRFVLEMHQGWFARRAIGPGYRLTGAPFTPRP
jgi:uncharacterized membrane protein (UPF0127 family)